MVYFLYIYKAECEELAQRADALREENASLREEVEKVKKKQKELLAQNKALKVSNLLYLLVSNETILTSS